MVKVFALAALAAVAFAAPAPQELDFGAIDELPDVVDIFTKDVQTLAPTSVYNSAAVMASIKADVIADPLDGPAAAVVKRATACAPLPTGTNTYPIAKSPVAAFKADQFAADLALNAPTPNGYLQTFRNYNASTKSAANILGSYELPTYDTNACAVKCDSKVGCQAFNIYISRDPTLSAADPGCPDPPATVFVRCVIYGRGVGLDSAKNYGQYRVKFQTAVIASNGYNSARNYTIPGFDGPIILDDRAINAPNDCNGKSTYMGVKIFTNPVFDANACAKACNETNAYNIKQAAKADPPKTPNLCRFFNTYVLHENDEGVGQYCAMYTQYWDQSYATNKVQYRGDDFYTKSYSFVYYHANDKGYASTCSGLLLNEQKPVEGTVQTPV